MIVKLTRFFKVLHTERLEIFLDRSLGYDVPISKQEEIDHYQLEEGLHSQILEKLTSDGVSMHKLSSNGMTMDDPIMMKSHMEENAVQALWGIDDSMKDALIMCMAILLLAMFPAFVH